MRKTRLKRTDELLRETIAELILTRLGDPRVGFVSVTGVKISPELDTARVFVTVLGNPAERETAMKGLQSAAPYLQSELHKRVRLRRTPKLRFWSAPVFCSPFSHQLPNRSLRTCWLWQYRHPFA